MKNKALFNADRGAGMVSPLVDVVMNLMITFFVFLIIYMAVVVPEEEGMYDPPGFVANYYNRLSN
jgi:hypothetical protein